jgi:hypothetical protein
MKAKALKVKALAIVALAFCAGLFVTVTPNIASAAGVTVAERSTATSNANAVNRIGKGDRQPQGVLAKQDPTFSPSTETVPALPKRTPLECDAVFSSAADPAGAHICKRCMV